MDRIVILSRVWDRIWAWRRAILTLAFSATLVVGVVAYSLPVWYQAEAELLPPGQEDVGLGLASYLRSLAVPGLRIPTQASPSEVFMLALQSRRINEGIVDRFDLKRRYKKRLTIDALQELERHVQFEMTQGGSIQIRVEARDRQLAADMTNAYVEMLDQFNRQVRMTNGRRIRIFVGEQVQETRRLLAEAEQRLGEYQTRHKTVALPKGMTSAVEEASNLYAQRIAIQVRLGVVQGYSRGSEEELQLSQELAELDRQISALPETGLELARLMRDVKLQERVFVMLTAQYEEARIKEARDIMTVDLLDVAQKPEYKFRPHRITMMASAFLLSLVLGVGMAIRAEDPTEPMLMAVGE